VSLQVVFNGCRGLFLVKWVEISVVLDDEKVCEDVESSFLQEFIRVCSFSQTLNSKFQWYQ
jgi:hypothetical protein